MKLYRNLVNAVAETLKEIFTNGKYADRCIEQLFKRNPQWGSRDRRFVAESVYDIVRYYRLYAELAGNEKNFWFMTAAHLILKGIELPDWQEFKHFDAEKIIRHKEKLCADPAVRESYPQWLWDLGMNETGKEKWEKEAASLNETAKVVLRMNSIKTSPAKFEAEMKKENILLQRSEVAMNCYVLEKRENVFRNKYFKEGWFEVQDAGSQAIGEFTDPKEGMTVIDACAGAGGKSLHLAALMKNKGKIISMDVEQWKLDECKKRAARANVHNIETRMIQGEQTITSLKEKADIVLLDVPCSGTGVIKRNPDTKWKLTPGTIEKTKEIQRQILNDYSKMVKPGGKLIYSTCSIFPSENEKQVESFLKLRTEFQLTKQKSILPSEGYDGFYMAELKKIN